MQHMEELLKLTKARKMRLAVYEITLRLQHSGDCKYQLTLRLQSVFVCFV
jgi:hypothetical protein